MKKLCILLSFFLLSLLINATQITERQEFTSLKQGFIEYYIASPKIEDSEKEYKKKIKEFSEKYNWLLEVPIENGIISLFEVDKKNYIEVVQINNFLKYTSYVTLEQMDKNMKKILEITQKSQKQKNNLNSFFYYSLENNSFSKEKNNKDDLKFFILSNIESLKEEFENNEPRALHNYSKDNIYYLISGQIKKLDAGLLEDKYIIHLKNGIMIYIEPSEVEKYFELNKNDWVYLKVRLPKLVLGDIQFLKGYILTSKEYLKLCNDMLKENT